MKLRAAMAVTAVAALGLGVAACGDDEGTSTTAASEEPAAGTVSFTEPADGATTSDTVTADVELAGFEIDADAVGMAPDDGHGHLHFSLDGGEYDNAKHSGPNGELAEELGVDGKYSPATEPTITYEGLPAGEHTLEVELANNDHSPTGSTATTTFTVE